MADVTLSAAVRSSLLSLQDTSKLVKQTQSRLSTGLRVASAIDDPVSFFQAKSLNDRGRDLSQKKDGIDQGISTVTAALDAVTAVENIVQQLKGLANSLKSATGTQFTDLISQFNSLRTQIGNLVADASYQGTNLVNNTSQSLTVEFSDKTASLLTINASKLDQAGLAVGSLGSYVSNSSTFMINYSATTAVSLTAAGNKVVFTYMGQDASFTSASYLGFNYGTADVRLHLGTGATLSLTQGVVYSAAVLSGANVSTVGLIVGEQTTALLEVNYSANTAANIDTATNLHVTYNGPDQTFTTGSTISFYYQSQEVVFTTTASTTNVTLTQGTVMTYKLGTALTAGTAVAGAGSVTFYFAGAFTGEVTATVFARDLAYTNVSAVTSDAQANIWAGEGETTQINKSIAQLDAALKVIRSQASSLGSNVALLQTRLDFTNQYVNTLQQGAGKLTLADINQEGANLLALQTRQQLGITSLSFAGQAEQAILGLF